MTDETEDLTPEQIDDLGCLLEERLGELQGQLALSSSNAQPVGLDLSIGRLSRVDALQQQHMASAHKGRLQVQVAQIQQARARLRDGTYGSCVSCGECVGYGRLRAYPEALFCIRCQSSDD